ncbi:hypothetical protein KXW63_002590, partial [Aspergillus fumigatus]
GSRQSISPFVRGTCDTWSSISVPVLFGRVIITYAIGLIRACMPSLLSRFSRRLEGASQLTAWRHSMGSDVIVAASYFVAAACVSMSPPGVGQS